MRILLAAVAATMTLASAARAEDGESVISTLTYADEVGVTAEGLSCVFTPGNPQSYILRDTAWTNLTLGQDDRPVFQHTQAGLTVEAEAARARNQRVTGNPRALCPQAQAVIADAAAHGGKLPVQKKVVLSILTYSTGYGRNCERYMKETMEIAFATGLTLSSEQYKAIQAQPGSCVK